MPTSTRLSSSPDLLEHRDCVVQIIIIITCKTRISHSLIFISESKKQPCLQQGIPVHVGRKFGAPRGHPNSVSPSSSAAANLGRADRDSSLSSAYAARDARLLSASLMRAPIPSPYRQALGAHQATVRLLRLRRLRNNLDATATKA
ncbi:hypothetical protein ACFX11_012518 [Malus domestica]